MSKSDIITGNLIDLIKGFCGTSACVLAAITAHQEAFEFWLRCTLHLSGIAVAGVTMWSIIKRSKRL